VFHFNMINSRESNRFIQSILDIGRRHACTQLQGNYEAKKIIQDG
jgi:hypothetical protein